MLRRIALMLPVAALGCGLLLTCAGCGEGGGGGATLEFPKNAAPAPPPANTGPAKVDPNSSQGDPASSSRL